MIENIPFSYIWIVRKAISLDLGTVLDLGCGEGDFMKNLKGKRKWKLTGVELFPGSIKKAKKVGIYNEIVRGDVTALPKKILNKRFDVVFSSQVLEHLNKREALKALKVWERIARERVVVGTTVGFIDYDPIEKKEEKNPLQKHLSGWSPNELIKMGYSVRGQGAKFIYGKNGLARKFPSLISMFGLLSLIVSPVVYFKPDWATYMIAYKVK